MSTLSQPLPAHLDGITPASYDVATIMGGLYGDGLIGLRGAFTREWVQALREDVDALFEEGLRREGALVGRGPKRYYAEIHPERIRGFTDLVTHPWVVAVCRAVLGPAYEIVEVGFDIPFAGAMNQHWHRDFGRQVRHVEPRRHTPGRRGHLVDVHASGKDVAGMRHSRLAHVPSNRLPVGGEENREIGCEECGHHRQKER